MHKFDCLIVPDCTMIKVTTEYIVGLFFQSFAHFAVSAISLIYINV